MKDCVGDYPAAKKDFDPVLKKLDMMMKMKMVLLIKQK
jgi:hypothetical protein